MAAERALAPAPVRTGRRIVAAGIASLAGIAILVGLGTWQLERKAWKEGLIAALAARVDAPPLAFPPESAWPGFDPARDEYRHVRLTGHFLHAKEAHAQANRIAAGPGAGELGYDILTPLRLDDGSIVIVDRGFVPLDRKDPATRPQAQADGPVTVTGLIRFAQTRPWFAPADDPGRNVWFSRDPAALARAYGLARVAPVIVAADPTPPGTLPIGGQTRIDLPNDHLQYALTWFGLAAALAGVFAAFALGQRKAG